MEDKEVKYDYNKEVKRLLTEQITNQNEIINKLFEYKKEEQRNNKVYMYCILSVTIMIFLICITMVVSYFFADYNTTNINSNTNTNTMIGDDLNGK